jgi:hypothetical protein
MVGDVNRVGIIFIRGRNLMRGRRLLRERITMGSRYLGVDFDDTPP